MAVLHFDFIKAPVSACCFDFLRKLVTHAGCGERLGFLIAGDPHQSVMVSKDAFNGRNTFCYPDGITLYRYIYV